jgi:uncharacterized protein (TIGR03067 family)
VRYKLGLVALFAITLAFAGCKNKEQVEADNAAKKAEQDKLQGKWKVVSRMGDEEEDVDAPAATAYYVIEGDIMKFVYKGNDGKEEEYSRKKLTLMADKDPKQVDLVYLDENNKPMKERKVKKGFTGKRKTSTSDMKDVAVYKVEGDKLTMAISFDESKRPTGFNAAKGSSSYVLTLEKIKDGTEKPAESPATKKSEEPATKKTETPATKKLATPTTTKN